MKKILYLACFCFLLTGCGNKSSNSIAESVSNDTEEVEVLDDATLTIPSAIIGDELADTNVIISDEEVASGEDLTLSISGEDRTQIVLEVKSEISTLFDEVINNEDYYPDIVSIEVNDSKNEFTVYTDTTDLNSIEGMLVMSLYNVGDKYQIYMGIPEKEVNTSVKYINKETNEAFFEGNSSNNLN